MNTQLLFCIKENKQLIKLGKYFADFNFRGWGLTAKYPEYWMTREFPILRYNILSTATVMFGDLYAASSQPTES